MPEARLSVLLVAAHSAGGIGRHVRTLVERLPARGVDVTVCAPAATLAFLGLSNGSPQAIDTAVGATGPVARRSARRALRRAAKGADVVHAHGLRAGADCVALAASVPLVVTWHNAPLGGRLWRLQHGALARYVARSTDLTLAASSDLAAAARSAGARRVREVFVAAPALPPPRRTAGEVRAELGVGERPLVLAVGRLQHQKRLDVLVAAAAGWADDDTAPVVVIAGDGPDRDSLAAQAAELGASVRLLGARDDVPDLLVAADLVALPSEWEARALVAQEALRSGVPLVATAVGGLPELVGDAAVMVPVGDASALRTAIESVLAEPAQRARLRAAGLQRARSWPDEGQALDVLVAAYLDLKERSRPR